MRVVVTGTQGQVACSLIERGAALGHEIVALGRPELDLAGDRASIIAALKEARPEGIISAAAFTAVDKAEEERDLAFAVNSEGAGAVAQAASELGVPLVHLSTDYVFDGSKSEPYTEEDMVRPASVYGQSKLDGERQVLGADVNAAVLRTAWVFSPFGANFVKTMLRLAQTRDEVRVVADQRGNPTSALEIADGALSVLGNLARGGADLTGVFHMTGSSETNWADFARAIFRASAALGGPSAEVVPIPASDYPTAARRPANSRLDCSKIARVHGVQLAAWESSLPRTLERLLPFAAA